MRRLICLPYLRQSFPCRYWTLKSVAFSSSFAASYTVSIRQASVLPAASSGFHLAMDTLAVRLTIPPAGFVEDFHLRVSAPCRAHKLKSRRLSAGGFLNQNRPEITISRSGHVDGSPDNSPCGILLGNHGCRRDNGWSYWGRDACSCERLSAPCQIRHESPYIPPCVPDDRPSGRRPNDPIFGHPSGHGPYPALE